MAAIRPTATGAADLPLEAGKILLEYGVSLSLSLFYPCSSRGMGYGGDRYGGGGPRGGPPRAGGGGGYGGPPRGGYGGGEPYGGGPPIGGRGPPPRGDYGPPPMGFGGGGPPGPGGPLQTTQVGWFDNLSR